MKSFFFVILGGFHRCHSDPAPRERRGKNPEVEWRRFKAINHNTTGSFATFQDNKRCLRECLLFLELKINYSIKIQNSKLQILNYV